MKRVVFLLILLSFLSVSSVSADINLKPSFLWRDLTKPSEEEQISDVIWRIKEAIRKNPEDYSKYAALAIAYDRIGYYEEAVYALKSAIKYCTDSDAQWDFIYGNLARLYIILKQLDEAKDALDKAMEYNPDNVVNNVHLTQYYLMKNEHKKAALAMKKDSDYNAEKETYFTWYQYAMGELDIDTLGLAKVFRHVIELDPENYSAHRTFATAVRNDLENLEVNFPEVIAGYRKALDLKPKYTPTLICIADTYMFMAMRTKDDSYNENALAWFAKAYEVNPKNENLFYAMANFYNYNERHDEAILKLKEAILSGIDDERMMKSLANAYNNKAYSLYQEGKDLDKGLEVIEKAIALKPNDGVILSTKAELLYKMGRLEEAYTYIKKGIALEPVHTEIQQDLKMIEEAMKKLDK